MALGSDRGVCLSTGEQVAQHLQLQVCMGNRNILSGLLGFMVAPHAPPTLHANTEHVNRVPFSLPYFVQAGAGISGNGNGSGL